MESGVTTLGVMGLIAMHNITTFSRMILSLMSSFITTLGFTLLSIARFGIMIHNMQRLSRITFSVMAYGIITLIMPVS
jgi:hypothetical protein